MSLKQADWDIFYKKFGEQSGLNLHEYKAPQLQRRTLNMMESKSCSTLREFWKWISQDSSNMQWYMDKLAINVSELFRNQAKWLELEEKILPDLLSRTSGLKVWSAGCSYGAEAHTLAMIFAKSFGGRHKIIGTDIDEDALSQARRGEFKESDLREVPERHMKYLKQDGDLWRANEDVRKCLQFKRHNLLADKFDRHFDLIMCRNVVIYFTDEAKDGLYRRFFDALKPGGILFVGGTERIFKSAEIGYEAALPFFYRKPMLGAETWRNAS